MSPSALDSVFTVRPVGGEARRRLHLPPEQQRVEMSVALFVRARRHDARLAKRG